MKKFLCIVLLVLFSFSVSAADVSVEVIGEAEIKNGDLASAKIEAESRARWAAMEKASEIKVSADTIIYNSELLDESIKSEVKASIVSFKKVDEGRDGNTYWLKAEVTVRPDKAAGVVSNLSLNSSIVVYIPMVMPDGTIEEMHPFSEKIINELIDKGFNVIDIANVADSFGPEYTQAVEKGDINKVKTLSGKFLSSTSIIGKLTVIDKGNDTGYAKAKFKLVDGEVKYRIIGNKNDNMQILYTGNLNARGQGITIATASSNVSSNLAKRESPKVANIAANKLIGDNKKVVIVKYLGSAKISNLQPLLDDLKSTSWVLDVKNEGVDLIRLTYPEKTYYLATILSKKGYKVKSFSDSEIIIQY